MSVPGDELQSEQWARVRTLLDEALALKSDERMAFVAGITEAAMRMEVERLLGYDRASSEMFGVTAWKQSVGVPLDGVVLGSYKLLRELGRGGMGTVYLGERADGVYQQQVAVKLLQESIFTPALAERFRLERQILARLQHPGVARLLDGGVLPDGRPYLVLEYVDGLPIDRYCDEQKLDTNARLQLFLRVAEVVQSAHQQLVLHLDLKPANILVTAAGEPRLLDFGIARFLSVDADGDAATETTLRLLTPRYASPEQATGAALGVASDVFSLATLLYKLLTGKLPYPLEDAPPLEAARILCETPAALPSSIHPELQGDLDTILLQALRKEPERRYATVAALAEDVERHLQQRPLLAHADSFSYRMGKFVRRNRVAVAASALAALVLLGSGVAVLRSARIAREQRATAERRFADSRKLANSYINDMMPKLVDVPGTLALRKTMMTNAVQYLQAMSRERTNDVALEGELAGGLFYIAQIQGDPYVPNLGDTKGAMESYAAALAIQTHVLTLQPNDLEQQGRYMLLLSQMSTLPNGRGSILEAMDIQRKAWDAAQVVIAGHPKGSRYVTFGNIANHLAMNYSNDAAWNLADPAQCVAWEDKGLAVYAQRKKLPTETAPTARYLGTEIAMQDSRAAALLKLGRDEEARAIYERYIPLADATDGTDDRAFLSSRRWLHASYALYLLQHGKPAEATRIGAAAFRDPQREQADTKAGDLHVALSAADLMAFGAVLDLANGKTADGIAKRNAALAAYRTMRAQAPDLMWTTSALVSHLLTFAEMARTPAADARSMFNEVILLTTPYARTHPEVLNAQVEMGRAHLGLARLKVPGEAQNAVATLEPVARARPAYIALGRMVAEAKGLQ